MRAALALALLLAACTEFPALDGTIPPQAQAADFPDLVPLGPLLAGRTRVVSDPGAVTASLQGRVAALRSRARGLQARPVVDARTRARLRGAMG